MVTGQIVHMTKHIQKKQKKRTVLENVERKKKVNKKKHNGDQQNL